MSSISRGVSLPSFSLVELDWDGDGYLQRQEVPSHLNKYIDFSRFDHNQDGEIDAVEADTPAARIEGVREKIVSTTRRTGWSKVGKRFRLIGKLEGSYERKRSRSPIEFL